MKEWTKAEAEAFAKLVDEGRGFIIPLHHPFLLPGQAPGGAFSFLAGLETTEQWQLELSGGYEQLRREHEREQDRVRVALRTLLDLVQGSLKAEEAAERLKDSAIDGLSLPDPARLEAKLQESPNLRELLEHLLQFGELRRARVDRQLAEVEKTLDCITALGLAALDHKDTYAIGRLADIARYAVTILDALAEQQTDLVRPIARKAYQWPVMADVEPGWQEQVLKRLQKLQLGEDTLHGKFDKSKAYSLENVSRRYARGIVETLEKNRCCAALVPDRVAVINAKEKKEGVVVFTSAIPDWFYKAVKLPPFGPKSAEAWLDVGMEMLKEQLPRLTQSPDWSRIRTHWENRMSDPTPGRMWGSIKDALRSPIKTIAREQTLEPVTQKGAASLGNPKPNTDKA